MWRCDKKNSLPQPLVIIKFFHQWVVMKISMQQKFLHLQYSFVITKCIYDCHHTWITIQRYCY